MHLWLAPAFYSCKFDCEITIVHTKVWMCSNNVTCTNRSRLIEVNWFNVSKLGMS